MARRNDVATVGVQVTANTRDFVRGMAQAERSVERLATTTKRATPALSGIGAGLGRASFGKGAAIGSGATGVLEGLGLSGATAGLLGLATAGSSIAIFEAIRHGQQQMRESAERLARAMDEAAKQTQRYIEGAAEARDFLRQFTSSLSSTVPGVNRATALFDDREATLRGRLYELLRPTGGPVQQEEIDAIRAALASLPAARQLAQAEALAGTSIPKLTDTISRMGNALLTDVERQAAERAELIAQLEILQGGAGTSGQANTLAALGDRLQDIFAEQDRRARELADEEAAEMRRQMQEQQTAEDERTRELLKGFEQLFDDWTRQNQRQSDQITTSVNRINTQVLQLLSRRN